MRSRCVTGRALDTWLSEDLVAEAVEALLDLEDEIGAPDAIVSDPFLSASAIALPDF